MKLKTLRIAENLRESISENKQPALPQICIDSFDEYLGRQWECHWHPEIEIGIVKSGIIEFIIYEENQQKVYTLEEGDGIFIGSGTVHSAKSKVNGCVIYDATFTPELFDGCLFGRLFYKDMQKISSSGIKSITFSHRNKDDQEILDSIFKLCQPKNDLQGYELFAIESLCRVCRLLLQKVNGQLSEKFSENVSEIRAKKMLAYLRSHFAENIVVEDLAKYINSSRTECFRSFKSVIGQSPIEYLMQYRLQTAYTLLQTDNYTVGEVSMRCGFNNPSYFSKIFKQRYGISPKQCRK